MLLKLERVYLGILRVVILIIATVALLVAGVALVTAVPSLVRRVTSSSDIPSQPRLATFIQEKKVEGTVAKQVGADATPYVNEDVRAASTNLARYLRGRSDVDAKAWAEMIQRSDNAVILAHSLEYYSSLRKLSEELLSARGKPLSLPRVAELLEWHQQQFVEAVGRRDAERAADTASSTYTLTLAAAAFLFFVLIVFIFLFVRIERSLRTVHVVREASRDGHEG